jgi:hypothetical protein
MLDVCGVPFAAHTAARTVREIGAPNFLFRFACPIAGVNSVK